MEVAAGVTTGNVDFSLARLGCVAGTVTDEATGQPIAGVEVGL